MYLDDPAAMTNLLVGMADRNIISDEFVQRHIKAKPEMERRRVVEEEKRRVSKDLDKISKLESIEDLSILDPLKIYNSYKALKSLKKLFHTIDEDKFPTLTEIFLYQNQLPVPSQKRIKSIKE